MGVQKSLFDRSDRKEQLYFREFDADPVCITVTANILTLAMASFAKPKQIKLEGIGFLCAPSILIGSQQ